MVECGQGYQFSYFCKRKSGEKRVYLAQIGSERVKIGSEMVKIRPKMVKIDQIRRMCQNVPECGGMCTYVHICGGMSNLVLATLPSVLKGSIGFGTIE